MTEAVPMTYLVPNILVKVLVRCDIEADTASLKPLRLNLEVRVWHSRDDNVRYGQTFLHSQIARVDDMARVITVRGCRISGDLWPFGILLDGINVHGEHTSAIVRQESSERPSNDFRPEKDEFSPCSRGIHYLLITVMVLP